MEVKNIDPKIQTYLSARNLSIAEDMGFDTVMAPCNGCYHNLKKAEYDLSHDEGSKRGQPSPFARRPGTRPTSRARSRPSTRSTGSSARSVTRASRKRVKKSLKGLKIANYYGCMYTRPATSFPEKDGGRARNRLRSRISWTRFSLRPAPRTSIIRSRPPVAGVRIRCRTATPPRRLVLNLLETAEACGADVIATECPTCHTGLEMHQVRAEKVLGRKTKVKILYFTQLLGMALGLSPEEGRRAPKISRTPAASSTKRALPDDRSAPSAIADVIERLDGARTRAPEAELRARADDDRRPVARASGETILEAWLAGAWQGYRSRQGRGFPPARAASPGGARRSDLQCLPRDLPRNRLSSQCRAGQPGRPRTSRIP